MYGKQPRFSCLSLFEWARDISILPDSNMNNINDVIPKNTWMCIGTYISKRYRIWELLINNDTFYKKNEIVICQLSKLLKSKIF